MRLSPLKHPLAVLRIFLGLGQKHLADIAGCSTRTVQSIELGNRNLNRTHAARIEQATGVSAIWLLNGNPSQPMTNQKGKKYTADDFVISYVQFELFTSSKEPQVHQALQLHNQIRALELEEILNRAIRSKKWPVLKIMLDEFRDSILRELGEKEGTLHFDSERAGQSFSARWEAHSERIKLPEPLKHLRADAVKLISEKKVRFNAVIMAKVLKQHRLDRRGFWYPVFEQLKAQHKTAKK